MEHRSLMSPVLLTATVLACACGSGEVEGARATSEGSSGDPRTQGEVEIGEPTVDAGITEPPGAGDPSDRPWSHNTGPNDLGALVASGDIDVTTNGALIENVDVTGNIDIEADNVTLRNFRVDCDGSLYGVRVRDGADNVTVQDGEIWNCDSAGVYAKGTNGLFTKLYVHDMESDGLKTDGDGNTVSWSYLTRLGAGEGSHADGNQSVSGTNNTFEYNNFYMPKSGTPGHDNEPATSDPTYLYPGPPWRSNATFIMHSGTSAIIRNNWLTGGNYTIYGNPGTTVRNNIFGRENADHPSLSSCTNCNGSSRLCNGPFDDWSGNVWEDDGTEAGNNSSCD